MKAFFRRFNCLGLVRLLGRVASDHNPQRSRLSLISQVLSEVANQGKISSLTQRLNIELPGEKRGLIGKIENAFKVIEGFCQKFLSAAIEEEARERKWRLKEENLDHPLWKNDVKNSFLELSDELKRFAQILLSLKKDLKDLKEFEEVSFQPLHGAQLDWPAFGRKCRTH